MEKQRDKRPDTKKGGGKLIVISVIAVVIIVILIVIIVRLMSSRQQPPEDESEQRSVLVTSENVEEIIAQQPQEPSEADRYTVTMTTYWNFENGKSASPDAYVENSTDNSHAVYFDIALDDDEGDSETIYASPILPVGEHIENIQLDKELEDGIYDCVMTYHLVDDDQKTLSTVDVALTINVGNYSPIG